MISFEPGLHTIIVNYFSFRIKRSSKQIDKQSACESYLYTQRVFEDAGCRGCRVHGIKKRDID